VTPDIPRTPSTYLAQRTDRLRLAVRDVYAQAEAMRREAELSAKRSTEFAASMMSLQNDLILVISGLQEFEDEQANLQRAS
jgi:hypothetical protein